MTQDIFKLIEQATSLFTLKEISPYYYLGLLYPYNNKPFSYGRPALGIYVRIENKHGDENCIEFFACIRSIDDSGVSIFGPPESKKKAIKRLEAFIEFIKNLKYRCPSTEELRDYCKTAGIQEDYW